MVNSNLMRRLPVRSTLGLRALRGFVVMMGMTCGLHPVWGQDSGKTGPQPEGSGPGHGAGGPSHVVAASWRMLELAANRSGSAAWGILDPGNRGAETGPGRPVPARFDSGTQRWRLSDTRAVPEVARPVKVAVFEGGRAVCLWRNGDGWLLTLHGADGGSQVWCAFGEGLVKPRLLPLSDGGLVVTELGPKIIHLPQGGDKPQTALLPGDWWTTVVTGGKSGYSPPEAVECGDGSVWLWSYTLHGEPLRTLDGVVKWNVREGGLPEKPIFGKGKFLSGVVSDGTGHMLAATAGEGLLRVSLSDFKAEAVPGPGGGKASGPIEKLAHAGSSLFAVTCPPIDSVTWQDHGQGMARSVKYDRTRGRTGTLWRRQGDSVAFEPVLAGLDERPPFGWSDRPLLETDEGILVGAANSGPWWIPRSAVDKPFLLEVQDNFLLDNTAALAAAGDKAFLARTREGNWALRPWPGPKPAENRLRNVRAESRVIQDSRRHLWAFGVNGFQFAEWDGRTWRDHPLPENVKALPLREMQFMADAQNQGWLLSGEAKQTAVFDMSGSFEWKVFDTLEAAVEEKLQPGDPPITMDFRMVNGPIAHANGVKGFLKWPVLHVLIGGKWTRTPIEEIAHRKMNGFFPLYFNKDGVFCLPNDATEFQCLGPGQWREVPWNMWAGNTYADDGTVSQPASGWGVPDVYERCRDRFGVVWLTTYSGDLWKWLDGRRVRVTDQGNPVMLPRKIRPKRVLIDPVGNTFLGTGDPTGEIHNLMLTASPPGPSVAAPELVSPQAGAAFIKLSGPPGALYRWRVDGEPWQDLTEVPGNKIDLKKLLPGDHLVHIMAYDADLSALGDLHTMKFTLSAVEGDALAHLVSQLLTGDLDQREEAARLLRAQGRSALPGLRRSLEDPQADETQLWWLRAVIQQIERGPGG